MPGRHSLDLYEYADYSRILEIDELLAMFPEAAQVADPVPIRFRTIPSPAIRSTDWLELNNKIFELVRADPSLAGVVITHGTDTIEETAYFLHLAAKVAVPIVMVAAQRPPWPRHRRRHKHRQCPTCSFLTIGTRDGCSACHE